MKFRMRISTVLMLVNVAIITLPLGSFFFFRIYENQLVQETERELISQAAVVAAAYQATFRFVGASPSLNASQNLTNRAAKIQSIWSPITPQLDLAKVDTLPQRPDGLDPTEPPSALAVEAGRALSGVLKRAQQTTLVGVRVLDENGTAVGGTAEVGQNFGHIWEVRKALNGDYASALRFRELENAPSEYSALSTISRGTKVRVFVAFPIVDNDLVLGVVYLSRTPKSVIRHMYDERDKVVLALLTVLFLAVGLAMLTSRTISRPVAQLLSRTGRVARGESATMVPLERPGTREMAELSEGIGRMADALVERAAYIRTLATHVSHEFKTPLASIQGAVELLQDHSDGMAPEERRRFLGNIAADSTRLKALLDRLLDLARAENAVRSDELVDLREAVETAVAALPESVAAKIEIDQDLQVRIAPEALGIVLSNLVENAAQHGATEISLAGRRVFEQVEITIVDNGCGITQANRSKVFEHFFTTRREEGGTGLGLGIAQALLKAHGGEISLLDSDGGAAFRVRLQT